MHTRAASLVVAFILPSSAFADVVVTSRTSSLTTISTSGDPLHDSWNESGFLQGVGVVTVSTPHGSFTSNATTQGFDASMSGSGVSGTFQSGNSSSSSESLEVLFQVTGQPISVQLLMNGHSEPIGNIQILITNTTTSATIFNSDNVATLTGFPPIADWNNYNWSSLLAPGSYRFYAYAGGGSHLGGGGGSASYGYGLMTFNLTFAPTPSGGAAGLLGSTALFATRRRR